jgi:putative holliday junction resolvase
MPSGKVLALDLGTRTIGVAVSDEEASLARALAVIARKGGRADLDAVMALIDEHAAAGVVIGLPLDLDGEEGTAARRVRAFAGTLKERLSARDPRPFLVSWDERFSTVQAEATLLEAGLSREQRKKLVDALAAQVILQGWLDRRRGRKLDEGEEAG